MANRYNCSDCSVSDVSLVSDVHRRNTLNYLSIVAIQEEEGRKIMNLLLLLAMSSDYCDVTVHVSHFLSFHNSGFTSQLFIIVFSLNHSFDDTLIIRQSVTTLHDGATITALANQIEICYANYSNHIMVVDISSGSLLGVGSLQLASVILDAIVVGISFNHHMQDIIKSVILAMDCISQGKVVTHIPMVIRSFILIGEVDHSAFVSVDNITVVVDSFQCLVQV